MSYHFLSHVYIYDLEISPISSSRFVLYPAKYLMLLSRDCWAGDVCRRHPTLPHFLFGVFYLTVNFWAGWFQLYPSVFSLREGSRQRMEAGKPNAGKALLTLCWCCIGSRERYKDVLMQKTQQTFCFLWSVSSLCATGFSLTLAPLRCPLGTYVHSLKWALGRVQGIVFLAGDDAIWHTEGQL